MQKYTSGYTLACYIGIELCAGELVVGGGVRWFHDRRRRRAAHFHRRRRRGFMVGGSGVGGVRPDKRAVSVNSAFAGHAFFSGFTGVSNFTCDLR